MEQPQVIDNTFYSDFTIAERFGLMAIQDTYNRSFKAYKNNIEHLTALAMALNHKIWAWCAVDGESYKNMLKNTIKQLDPILNDTSNYSSDVWFNYESDC